ncbi:hypothetical protein AB0392_27915, partial [Nonomuraea angiospora]|uniref:hypothetical protein n=1 Tax=Nonomuraea angiospora TaxID=46172 RepID=UPI0034501AC1
SVARRVKQALMSRFNTPANKLRAYKLLIKVVPARGWHGGRLLGEVAGGSPRVFPRWRAAALAGGERDERASRCGTRARSVLRKEPRRESGQERYCG